MQLLKMALIAGLLGLASCTDGGSSPGGGFGVRLVSRLFALLGGARIERR